ncbi:MAG: hypothetical protein QOG85_2337 [Gaiellaceae bacterium]|nr:hypothetical protein [Gaiellaceae bacterium]
MVEFRIADDVTPNFHQGIVAYRDREVAVVCTRDSAILAVAEPRNIGFPDGVQDSGPLRWVDAPELAAALAERPGFQVLDSSELDGPLDTAAWPGVLPSDIAYWRPGTLGEALFN